MPAPSCEAAGAVPEWAQTAELGDKIFFCDQPRVNHAEARGAVPVWAASFPHYMCWVSKDAEYMPQ